jgi:tetratricopeptide (TPR) repeat protein
MSTPQWVQQIREWAMRQIQAWDETLEARRNASVNRLMEMLDKNPDEGLRHAIPLTDEGTGRGIASPGSELVARNWGWGSSTSGSDSWALEYKAQMRLRVRYLELAQREVANGRFEKAAIIYVQLLGDYTSAAQTLEKGGLLLQAAMMYRDKLHQKTKAADLFRKLGDFDEAVILYIAQGMNMEAGDLYAELGLVDKAEQSYQAHVDVCRSQSRWCDAADAMVIKLSQLDAAVAMLQQHWPHGKQGRNCIQKTMSLLVSANRPSACIEQIDRLLSHPISMDIPWSADFLADTATKTGDALVREHSYQALFRLASNVLDSNSFQPQHATVAAALRRLVPEDRLLHRDSQKFVLSKKPKRPVIASTGLIRFPSQTMKPSKTICMPTDTEWFGMIPTERGPVCFGERFGTLVVSPSWSSESTPVETDSKAIPFAFDPSQPRRWLTYSKVFKDGREQ